MRTSIVIPLILLAGCSSVLPAPRDLTGQWAAPISVPGAGFGFTLSEDGDSLHGAGNYSIEAGPSGTFTVRGAHLLDSLQIEFAYDTGRRTFFSGHVVTSHMFGTMSDSLGQSYTATFDKR